MTASDEFAGTARFEVLSRLGKGGMGIVYEVLDRERGTRVALKKLRAPTPEALLRFKSEFRALEDVQHPNLVMLGELIEDGGDWFFTMELVEGLELLDYLTPGDGGFDEERLRDAFRQLASAVAALHAAGKVHRDIKPSNIMVQSSGRLALLDLGLVLDLDEDTVPERDAIAGTAAYMAPEQAVASGAVGPEADWYSVGVVLYQALTGRLPFEGSQLDVMAAKQERMPTPPEALAEIPNDLAELCKRLLAIAPDDRPTDAEVLRSLRATAEGSHPSSGVGGAPFVGRAGELDALRAAYRDAGTAGAVTVVVEGASGVGKTSLVQRFIEIARSEVVPGADRPLILAGRCHEREAVPFKAFDDIVDGLAGFLIRQPRPYVEAVLPRGARMLAQVFPVLRRVEAIAVAPRAGSEPADNLERRGKIFAALRELLARIGDRRRLILVIDDLQWADADSLVLLRELLRPPDPPPLLLVSTVRTDSPGEIDLPGDVRRVPVPELPDEDAVTLARYLLGQAEGSDDAAVGASIARGAGGHPLFISELVRYRATHPGAAISELPLEQALWSRVRRLSPELRRLLSLIVVAGGPLRQDLAAVAAEAADFNQLARWVSMLRRDYLVRTTGVRAGDRVEPYHDRVRAAVRSQIPPELEAICHRRLAIALEGDRDADPEALAYHWRGASEPETAARHAVTAAEQADAAFAFDRAARLYALSLELSDPPPERRAEILARLGDALANAGRGAAAGEAYLEAAELAHQSIALDLLRRAAEQYLRAGHIRDGMRVLDRVLEPIGMRLAKTPRRALMSLLLTRARVRMRGLGFRPRDEREIPREALVRIDTCWAVSIGLALVDTIRASDFQARQLLLSLKMGEPFRICRALSAEAGYRSVRGGGTEQVVARLLDRCGQLASELDDPRAFAFHRLTSGISSYLYGQWQAARQHCEAAERHLEQCSGMAWELFNARYYPLLADYWMGDLSSFLRIIPGMIADADERGDLLAGTTLRNGLVAMSWLILDDPDRARSESIEVVSRLPDGFNFQHYWQMVALANAGIYAGDPTAALAAIDDGWDRSKKGMVLMIQYIRTEAHWTRARAHLAAAVRTEGLERERHLKLAARDAKKVAGEGMPWTAPFADLLAAGLATLRGDPSGAIDRLRTAADQFDAVDMRAFAQAARYARGHLLGGDEGRAATDRADQWLRQEGVVDPRRLVSTWITGAI